MDKRKFLVYLIVFLLAAAVTCLIIQSSFNIKTFGALVFLLVFIPTVINLDIGFVIIIVSMLFSPEVTMGEAGYRQVTLRIEDLLLAVVILAWFTRTAVTKNIADTLKTGLTGPFFLYLGACVASTVFANIFQPPGSIKIKQSVFTMLKYLEYFLLFLMVKDHLKSIKQVKIFLIVFFLVAVTVGIFSNIYIEEKQKSGEEFFRVAPPAETRKGQEAGTMGAYLLFMMAMAGGILLHTRSAPQRVFLIILMAMIFRGFLYTLSRGSYLGFIALAAGFILFTRNPILKIKLLYAFVIFFVLLAALMPKMVRERITTTVTVRETETTSYLEWEESPQARIDSWKDVLVNMFPRSPLFGHGVARYFVDSQWFLTLAETGLVGLFLLVRLLAKLFKMARHVFDEDLIKNDSLASGLCVGFLAGFMGLLAHSISANTFIIIKAMEPFWFMAAIILSLPLLLQNREITTDH